MYYANGYFNAKSTALLAKKEYETLLKTDNELFFSQLRNLGFGVNMTIDELYNHHLYLIKKDLETTIGSVGDFKVLFYPIDLTNTKLLYKQIYKEIEGEPYFLEGGNLSKEAIYNALKNNDLNGLTVEKDLFLQINKIDPTDFKLANITIEQLFYAFIQEQVKESFPLNKYIENHINMQNILTVIRAKELELSEKELLLSIIKTNSFDKAKAITLYHMNLTDIETFVEKLGYYTLSQSVKNYRTHKNIEKLETDFEVDFYTLMIDYTYNMDNYGFIMMYIYRKLIELNNIRLIYYNRNISLDDLSIIGE